MLLDTLLPDNQTEGHIQTDAVPIVPSTSNVRTRVHEYGDGAARVYNGFAYWSEFKDGRIYRRRLEAGIALEDIEALTPGEHVNTLLRISAQKSDSESPGTQRPTFTGMPTLISTRPLRTY